MTCVRFLLFVVWLWASSWLPAQQDLAPWRTRLASSTAPAADELPELLRGVDALLQSPDPVARDEVGFALLTRWLYRDRCVPVAQRQWLLAQWQPRLRHRLDADDADATAARSFAALGLSLLAALDLEDASLTGAEFAALWHAALDYLRDERDVRGFDGPRGWVHSVAHTADLLKFLLRSKQLTKAQQQAAFTAIAHKLASVEVPLVHGEGERLARAVLSLLARDDLDAAAFRAFVQGLQAIDDGAPSAPALARAHNRRDLLAQLHLVLTLDPRQTPPLVAARTRLVAALRGDEDQVAAPAAANDRDVGTLDGLIAALYGSISGPAGQARDWQRVRSLFHARHRMVPLAPARGGVQAVTMTVDDYVRRSGPMLERDGFFEQEIARHVLVFGDLAHVWSTYEARKALGDAQPWFRGINSIQCVREGGRWWILQIAWEQESEAGPIPAGYLPAK